MPRLPPSDHSSGFRRLTEQPGLGALFLFIAALALLAPRLGTAGLWDPHEVRLLESAAEPTSWSNLFEAKAAHPRLLLLPIALGVRVFGENEMGGRAPMLALGVLTLLVMYAFGWWLASAKATGNKGAVAVLSGLVLLSTPLFFLSARHASLTLPPMLAQTLAVFGLSLLGWPRAKWRGLDLGLGALLSGVGLFCGFLCNGVLVGVAAPLLAVATALALTGGPFWPQVIYGGLCGGALVPLLRLVLQAANLPPAWRYAVCGACLLLAGLGMLIARDRGKSGLLWLSIMTTVIALGLLLPSGLGPNRPSGYSPFVAGVLHWPTNHEAQIDTVLRGLGFYFFPWVGLVPLGIVALFSELSESASSPSPSTDAPSPQAGFVTLLPLSWFVISYAFTTLHSAFAGDISFPALPALALLLGFYLAQALQDGEAGGVAAGLCAGLCIVMVGHDFFFAPEQYLNGHLTETLHWPAPLQPVGEALTLGSVALGLVFGLGLGAHRQWRRRLVGLAVGLTLLTAVVAVHGLAPALAKHLSYRGLYTRYQKLGGGALALYGVQQASGRIYGQNSTQLYALPDVLHFLANKPDERAFVIVGAGELGAVDREARVRGQQYFVVDDTNAQFLLLTNRLLPGEEDLNPLRRMVSSSVPHPLVPLSITFDKKIQLVGYDLPTEISRGDELIIRLYYKVLAPVSASYRVFLHFDGMGSRFNGDHVPVVGKYPTNFWSPGTYVIDEHRMSISRINQQAGYYQIYTGFWPGGEGARLQVTEGEHESDQRVHIGVLKVK